jgi:hypothetical protein
VVPRTTRAVTVSRRGEPAANPVHSRPTCPSITPASWVVRARPEERRARVLLRRVGRRRGGELRRAVPRAAWSGPFAAHVVPSGWAATTARSRALTLARGHEYCFSVRARDRAGNLSAWSAERCTAVPLDDRDLARTTGGWTSSTASTAFAGTLVVDALGLRTT